MEYKYLIGKLQELRQIKPDKNWSVFVKSQILAQEPKTGFLEVLRFFLQPKPALAGIVCLTIIFGFLAVAKNSLPGDPLYIVRKAAHKGESLFVSQEEKPVFQLKLANERLEDLAKAPARNLAPTLIEFQTNMSEAARDLARIEATTSSPLAIKKIVEATRKIEENKQKIEALGVVIGEESTSELNTALAKIVKGLIEDLEGRTLSGGQEKILEGAKELYDQGRYSAALEYYLLNQ